MTRTRLSALVAALLMAIAFAGAKAWTPSHRLADDLAPVELASWFPTRFEQWKVDDSLPPQIVSPDLQARLDVLYNQTLSRVYVNDRGERIMLSVAYGGDQSDATRAHLPEVCYPAQGFEITSRRQASVATATHALPVNRLVARQGGRIEPITYWMTVGSRVSLSGTSVKLAQLRYATRGVIPDGMLVRVSSISADTTAAFDLQAQFVKALASSLRAGTADRVVGSPSTV